MRVKLLVTTIAFAMLGVCAPLAAAVSYPTGEVSGNSVPYVADIMWVEEPGDWDGKTITNSCTGTFISKGYVVTAAHCVAGAKPENLYIGVGASLSTLGFCAVLAFEDHPRYLKRRISVNDIALLRVTEGCEPRRYPRIPSGGTYYRSLMLYGWGINQNSEDPQELGALRVQDLTSIGTEIYGRQFNPAVQIAAARYFAREDIFGGACSGDSGGPLIAKAGGKATLVGVVSWGRFFGNTCELSGPTVFSNMSAYTNWLYPAAKRISRLIDENAYSYVKGGGDGTINDGIEFRVGGAVTSSELMLIQWGYVQHAAPAAPVAFTFGIDTTFDGTPELNGDATQIVNAATGALACTAVSDETEVVEGGVIRTVTFPTSCVRKVREFGDVIVTVTAGGVAKSIRVDGVAFPPTR